MGADEPLFVYRMNDPTALLFYLDRGVTFIGGELGDAPPGYVIVPAALWEHESDRAPGLEAILGPTLGAQPLILLRHGKAYARSAGPRSGSSSAAAAKPALYQID